MLNVPLVRRPAPKPSWLPAMLTPPPQFKSYFQLMTESKPNSTRAFIGVIKQAGLLILVASNWASYQLLQQGEKAGNFARTFAHTSFKMVGTFSTLGTVFINSVKDLVSLGANDSREDAINANYTTLVSTAGQQYKLPEIDRKLVSAFSYTQITSFFGFVITTSFAFIELGKNEYMSALALCTSAAAFSAIMSRATIAKNTEVRKSDKKIRLEAQYLSSCLLNNDDKFAERVDELIQSASQYHIKDARKVVQNVFGPKIFEEESIPTSYNRQPLSQANLDAVNRLFNFTTEQFREMGNQQPADARDAHLDIHSANARPQQYQRIQ